MSLASAQAAEARHLAATTIGYYNLQLGDSYWNFSAALGADYDSNVNLTQQNAEDDYIFRPEIDVKLLMPVSDNNTLNVSLGAGYSAYVMHSELRRYYITPDTAVSFDVYAGDFWINFHDRISVTENSYQDPTVANNGAFSQLENAIGANVVWDLNKLVLRFGYDHVNYSTLASSTAALGNPDGESEVFSASAGCMIKPGLQLGVELGGGILNYSDSTTNSAFGNATDWNAGLLCDSQFSQYTKLHISAGYTQYLPDTQAASGAQDFSGVYASLGVTHRLNQYLDYTLSAGRTINFAFSGGTIDLYFVRWDASWKIFQKTTLSTSFDYEHGSQLGLNAEIFDRYGPAINFGRAITERMNATLGCQFYWRGSNLAGRDYTTFIISSNLRYRF